MKIEIDYDALKESVKSLIVEDDWIISNMSNVSSFIFGEVNDLNWAGFYIMRRGRLELGPFIGQPACVRIPLGSGVCGTAAALKSTMLVPDVHEFPGHIACDENSQSEIVVPIKYMGQVVAVLDIDSPMRNRFGEKEQLFFEYVAKEIERVWDKEINK